MPAAHPRNNPQAQRTRNRFLNAPENHRADTSAAAVRRALATANRQLEKATARKYPIPVNTKFHRREATASSAIEGVYAETAIALHTAALTRIIKRTPTIKTMLEAHRTIMRGQTHAQPGMLRTVNVRVGDHVGPPHEDVPGYMAELYSYIQDPGEEPLIKAVYAHLQFETIHPFADGNGRTGRALINQIIQCPVPLSEWILSNRPQYYSALSAGDWSQYASWMLQGMAKCLKSMAAT